ncbi:AP-4 complex subunit epsilon [Olea europaea subsp. europaea]|uniref:AP-4 complex subunit epsilon n=1 Tax=Olea europaea subsp. europaea TaxID=158383 RepID=A0A8S0QW85_OLEEU|nr:AP-4 complex subunit epsilon [Olea europaea subsp. europaea]
MQIKLLKILGLLGNGDKKASEHMYTIVGDIMRKFDSTSNIGNAVLYECICCVSSIHPNPKLLETAADAISKFLKSDSHNLRYLGIDALGRLTKINPEIAEQHQLAVIDCLEDLDDTLKRKTFELLYKMTKSSNVEVIVNCMVDYMININDNHFKTEIASRCVELAEQFAPSNQWFIQTMNKVFEHAGDLVNAKVAHNLMRLIAEGFGEDDNIVDSQLRSSAVESYTRIIGEPILPSAFLQVICWVLGEYGTADGKYSASYISGKLCDVAEALSTDEIVKAYAVTALGKIYSFEIAAGRKVNLLPECESLIEELLASHSTDLQQRAYELRALIGLDAHVVANLMPMDASCEDIEIDKGLSFLDGYIQQAIENGAQPYVSESERLGMSNISNFKSQEQHEFLTHSLRFEAYELPKPSMTPQVPPVLASPTELFPVSVPYYHTEVNYSTTPVPSISSAGSSELQLRLDGVQKKWGHPSYFSPTSSTLNSDAAKIQNGSTKPDSVGSANSEARHVSYDSRKPQVEISPEKQKLAASLFGGASKSDRRQSSSSQKVPKNNSHAAYKSHVEKTATSDTGAQKTSQPPSDLLDLGETTGTSILPSLDPFKQLEGVLDQTQDPTSLNTGGFSGTDAPDIMSLYVDTSLRDQGNSTANLLSTVNDSSSLLSGFSDATNRTGHGGNTVAQLTQKLSEGPNHKDSLEKDATVRQMGVTPSGQNPNLFKDLLG